MRLEDEKWFNSSIENSETLSNCFLRSVVTNEDATHDDTSEPANENTRLHAVHTTMEMPSGKMASVPPPDCNVIVIDDIYPGIARSK
jgi:hypothetical protein